MIFVLTYFEQSPEEHGPKCMFKIVNITTKQIILRDKKTTTNNCLISKYMESDHKLSKI